MGDELGEGGVAEQVERSPTDILEEFIERGLEYIKQGDYKQAIKYFRNKDIAKAVGFIYGDARSYIVTKNQSPEGIEYLLFGSGLDSSFMHITTPPKISLADVSVLQSSGGPTVELPEYVFHNVALVHAEEWLHGLQFLKGKPIAGFEDPDIDVAFYLRNHAVPLTESFLKDYGRNNYPELRENTTTSSNK